MIHRAGQVVMIHRELVWGQSLPHEVKLEEGRPCLFPSPGVPSTSPFAWRPAAQLT